MRGMRKDLTIKQINKAWPSAFICGQLAGAFYGQSGIPARWLKKLVMRKEISAIAKKLYNARV
jgi:ADP-ribosyl-[dinitrogen reductase] hydrolase